MGTETDIQMLKDKIDQLNKQAWELRVSNSTQAHMLSKEAFVLAEGINYEKGKAEGYRTYAFTLIRLSRHQEALDYAEKSMAFFESLNDLEGQSSIYEYYGIIQRSYGNYSASIAFLFKALELSQQTGNKESESLASYHLGVTYKYLGDFEKALNYLLQGLSIARLGNYWIAESYSLNLIGIIYFETGDYTNALNYYHQSLNFRKQAGDKWGEAGCLDNIGIIHFKLKDNDRALDYCSQALAISQGIDDKKGEANSLFHLGNIYEQLADYNKATNCYNNSLIIRQNIGDKKGETEILLFLAGLYLKDNFVKRSSQEVFELLDQALQLGQEVNVTDLLAKIHLGYYEAYKHFNRYQQALTHIETYMSLSKEIHSDAINQRIQNIEISNKAEKSKKDAEIYRLRNVELANLYEESKRQKEEIQITLSELKSAQAQLIQSEKMASLGELTAGIAHEIQNPLNFVNNFSEVSSELVDEIKETRAKKQETRPRTEEDEIEDEILEDIKQNLKKINHHGNRASGIVKGMLEHSRTSSGQKELTDLNALVDEYLRLAYHGLKAKDKSFNAKMETDLDPALPKMEVVPQDIGRLILNLITNAFYAVNERKKKGETGYEPTVSVKTKKKVSHIEISVKDNGSGIPEHIKEKIFQPFFTTKPAGQGTGLGLSLSYDIVKAHGGELKVETKESEGTEFIVFLPEIKISV